MFKVLVLPMSSSLNRLVPSEAYVPGMKAICWTKSSYLLVCPLLILVDTLVLTGIVMGMLGICVGMAGTG